LLIRKGLWSAKGSVVFEGSSLGVPVEVDLDIVEDQDGITLTGEIQGAGKGDVSIRIGADDVGTYVVDARVGSFALDGIAKLESEPNVCLLWNQGQTQSATVSLFVVDTGIGCRGFSGRRTRLLLGRFCSGPHSKWWVVTMWCL
jgi:hypothetical protein